MIFLSVVIPAYNEALRLPETLVLLREFLQKQNYSYEVLIINDGSEDNTAEVVKEMLPEFKGLVLIDNQQNSGKGKVVRQGVLAAQGEYRLFMDADGSTPVQEIGKLLKEVPAYQIVIGSRYLHSGSIKVKQPWKRRFLSRSGNFLIRLLLVPGIKDTQCGFKLFSAKAAQDIFSRQTMSGWSFDLELLTIARHLGYAIKEVPVDWFDAKRSTLRATKAAWRSLRDLWQIRRNLKLNLYN